MITVTLNGEEKQLAPTASLQDAIIDWQLGSQTFAVAVNQQFIPQVNYPQTALQHGDRVELVVPMQGG